MSLPMDKLGQCRLQISNVAPGECVTVNVTPGSKDGGDATVAWASYKLDGKGPGLRIASTITGLPFLITNFKVIDTGSLELVAAEHKLPSGLPVTIGEFDCRLYLWASEKILSVDVSYSSTVQDTQAVVGFALGDSDNVDNLKKVPKSKGLELPWVDLVGK